MLEVVLELLQLVNYADKVLHHLFDYLGVGTKV